MLSLIDAISAVVTGGLILVAIFTSLFNVQASSHNITFLVTLLDFTNVQLNEIESCLGKLGVDVEDPKIIAAEPERIAFRSRWSLFADTTTSSVNIIELSLGDSTAYGRPVIITQNDSLIQGTQAPLFLDALRFTYFDANEHIIVSPADSLEYIRMVRIDLEFQRTGATMERDIKAKFTSWKYLKNMYL